MFLQVIVHTAVRTKVPLKKKVRGERSGKQKPGAITKTKSTTKSSTKPNTSAGLMQAATIAAATTTQAFKRQGTALDNAKKLAKKKKRTPAPAGTEDTPEPSTVNKTKKSAKSKLTKHNEIIDYSGRTPDSQAPTNTFGKVQKWLLESPTVPSQMGEVEHTSKVRQIMTKSASTPERLALRAPKKVKSVDNMNDKVKLQVVYKPPFKFSLKLSKNSAVKTKVLSSGVGGSRSKRKTRTDKNERGVRDPVKPRRAALLIRTVGDEVDSALAVSVKTIGNDDQQQLMMMTEPNYETLNPKADGPMYENVNLSSCASGIGLHGAGKSDSGINTATFRINKSASGSNILGSISKYNGSNGSHSNTSTAAKTNSSGRGSSNNLNQIGTFNSYSNNNSSRGSTMNLSKQYGSSQNLIRSSTTNLAKSNSRNSFDIKRGFYDMSRSSTTNLSKDRRNGSHLNLLKHQHLRSSSSNVNSLDDISMPISSHSRGRRNSTTIKSNEPGLKSNNIPRVPSNSNLKMPSQRRSSVSNIPRASLNPSSLKQHSIGAVNGGAVPVFNRQTSLQPQPMASVSRISRNDHYSGRPHTADANNHKQFEWPNLFAAEKRSKHVDPLSSDLEVMVSDVENLVNDK